MFFQPRIESTVRLHVDARYTSTPLDTLDITPDHRSDPTFIATTAEGRRQRQTRLHNELARITYSESKLTEYACRVLDVVRQSTRHASKRANQFIVSDISSRRVPYKKHHINHASRHGSATAAHTHSHHVWPCTYTCAPHHASCPRALRNRALLLPRTRCSEMFSGRASQ